MIDRNEIAREQARLLRGHGMGYKRIAGITGLTRDAVRNACKRIDAISEDSDLFERIQGGKACTYCGGDMEQHGGSGRSRRFCSDYCRRQYWRLHRPEQKKKEDKLFLRSCAYCGKTFQVYGKNDRTYCCREHYRLHFYANKSDNFGAERLAVFSPFISEE